MVTCPVCDAEMDLEQHELDEGATLTCDECGANLAVSSVDPLELESLDEEEEEEEDEDDEEDEEEDEDEDLDYDEEEEEEEEEDEDWK